MAALAGGGVDLIQAGGLKLRGGTWAMPAGTCLPVSSALVCCRPYRRGTSVAVCGLVVMAETLSVNRRWKTWTFRKPSQLK